MRLAASIFLIAATLVSAGCREETAAVPTPFPMTAEAIGRYCGMNILEHSGPKGQVIVAHLIDPIWFSSARDAVAFTMLPEEPKDIRAVFVSDMGKAASWESPGEDNWVEVSKAYFVIGSDKKGGMGTDEAVPFSVKTAAVAFATEHGGKIVRFSDIPREYVLSTETAKNPDDGASVPAMHDTNHSE